MKRIATCRGLTRWTPWSTPAPQAGDKGRPINLILGLLIAGYGAFGLWTS